MEPKHWGQIYGDADDGDYVRNWITEALTKTQELSCEGQRDWTVLKNNTLFHFYCDLVTFDQYKRPTLFFLVVQDSMDSLLFYVSVSQGK